jgi:hypothetical protein
VREPQVPGYDIEGPLGQGATGSVWRATRCSDGVPVALKVVAVGEHDAAGAMSEVAVLRQAPVEGLVRCHEAVALPGPLPAVALVLDLVEGGSLASAVGARGHLSAGEAVTVASPVARTLAGLHALGVVHGDVSPANVLLEPSGRPVLADLGTARVVGHVPGEPHGTPGFVAPEVEAGAAPAPASDVYAAGALTWWCVTGEAPPLGPLRPGLLEVAPWVPPAFADVVEALLRGRPEDRPTASEAALALYDAAGCEPLALPAGADEVTLLTRRIRAAAPAAPTPVADPPGRRLRTLSRLGSAALSRARTGVDLSRAVRRRVALGAAAVVVVAGAVAVTGAGALPTLAGADSATTTPAEAHHHGPTSTSATAGTSPSRESALSAAAGLQRRPDAVVRDPAGLVRELGGVRASLLGSPDPEALAALDVPHSDAWRSDAALVARLHEAGQRFEGVDFPVRSARVLASTDGSARVLAVVGTSAHSVRGGDGPATARAAEPASAMVFHLRWGDGLWRVERITTAAAGG